MLRHPVHREICLLTQHVPDRFNAALFTVSHQVSQEAQDAFYEVNAIAIRSCPPACSELQLVRHIEYKSYTSAIVIGNPDGFISCVTEAFFHCPRLQSITVASEHISKKGLTVRQHLLGNNSCADMKADRIGLFEIVPKVKLGGRLWFKNFELTTAIPQAQALTSSFTISELNLLIMRSACDEYVGHIASDDILRFAFWLRCYEALRRSKKDPSSAATMTSADSACLQEFEHGLFSISGGLYTTPTLPDHHEQLPDSVSLPELSLAAGHSTELLEWASELLAYNFSRLTSWES